MRLALGVMLVAVAGFLALPSPAAAFHGSPYTARGTATFEDPLSGEITIYKAKVVWQGAGIGGVGTFAVELRDMSDDTIVHTNNVQGKEWFANFEFVEESPGCIVEKLDYRGYSTTSLVTSDITNGLLLDMWGYQHNHFCGSIQEMHYEGHYLHLYELVLDVWSPLT